MAEKGINPNQEPRIREVMKWPSVEIEDSGTDEGSSTVAEEEESNKKQRGEVSLHHSAYRSN